MTGFSAVAELAEEMATTGSRLTKRARIAEEVGKVHAAGAPAAGLDNSSDVRLLCLYLAGEPFSEADARKLNAGGALLTRAVLAVSGADQGELTVAYRRHGDLGAAAGDLWREKGVVPMGGLTLRAVEEAFAGMSAARTTAARSALVEGLLRRATWVEAKYLLKLMLGDMRIGVKASLVEEGIAVAACAAGAQADVAGVRHAVMLEADLGGAAERAFAGTLGQAHMRLFHPLGFMLASPVETPEEAVDRFTPKPAIAAKARPAKRPRKGKANKGVAREASAQEVLEQDVEAADLRTEASGLGDDGSADALLAGQALTELGDTAASGSVQAFLEDKYDGMRAQLHFGDESQPDRVAIYSRNRDLVTGSFPELEEAFCRVPAQGSGVILDGEILGWDFAAGQEAAGLRAVDAQQDGQALPFAVLGQRIGRKVVGNDVRRAIPVVFMAFDVMFAEGELQLGKLLRERRALLERLVAGLAGVAVSPLELSEAAAKRKKAQGGLFLDDEPGERVSRLMVSPAVMVEGAEAIDQAFYAARARGNEGVMIKAAGSAYLPGRRGLAWVKLKRVLDTLDVVVTGCEYGSGRKSQFLSDYTFAVRDQATGELRNVGKAYSGVTDTEITQLTEFFKAHTLEDHGHFRTVEPLVVFEVAFNNIMRSDRHASGFALRFPRIVRIREDKPVAEIDTVARVAEVYESQVDKPAE